MSGLRDRLARLRSAGSVSLLLASLGGLAVRGGETLARFLMTLLIARRLGAEAAGVFFLGLGLLAQSGLTRFALDRALIRHVAIAETASPGGVRAIAWRGILLGLIGPCLTAVLLHACSGWVAASIFRDASIAPALRMTALAMPPMALAMLLAACLTGLRHTASGQIVGSGLWPLVCAVGFAVLPLDLGTAFAVLLAATLAAVTAGFVLLLRAAAPHVPAQALAARAGHGTRVLLRTAWPLFPVEVVQLSLVAMPTLVLGAFAGAAEVGLFGVANRYALLLWVVIIGINAMAGPRFARAHAAGELPALADTARRAVYVTLFAGGPIVLLLLAVPGPLLGLLGHEFETASGLVRVMVAGQVVNLLFPCYAEMLAMTGHGRPLRTLNLVVLLLCLSLCFLLIPLFGAMGAAIATGVAIVANSLGPALIARSRLGIDPLAWARRLPAAVR